ncbi:alanine racemase domain protein [Leadbetterella byssophila DSM 17132]|uniref:Alanine racemase domain protein n=2 Tax=Leadbetterella TaxID=319458 RepID=E4RXW7_LEAB4|nr:alanine racemase domain protein [Leadbetterella byssophila DSM 17132]
MDYPLSFMKRFDTPSLLILRDKVEANIDKMIQLGGAKLMPHVKTHKMDVVTQLMIDKGIQRFKASTLAELEMVARCRASEVLLAHQIMGQKLIWFQKLKDQYPHTKMCLLVDCMEVAEEIQRELKEVDVYIDVNVGMNRTGIQPGEGLKELIAYVKKCSNMKLKGLHVYDGHITDVGLNEREQRVADCFEGLQEYMDPHWEMIAGGSPAFSVHRKSPDRTLSPGTSVFWDWGYGEKYTEQPYEYAALLLTRVISKPAPDLITVDLGHKGVGAENPLPLRVKFYEHPDLEWVSQSEEHGVLRTSMPGKYKIGDILQGVPYHVCPTVNLYDKAYVVNNGEYEGTWAIPARNRNISVC